MKKTELVTTTPEDGKTPSPEATETKKGPFEKRIVEIDLFRGILMILVIMDHIFNLLMTYNSGWAGEAMRQPFYAIYLVARFYWTNPARHIIRYIALGSFCFLSGISCAFSRNNWKRAFKMIIFWAIILVGSNILQWIYTQTSWNLGIRTFRIDFNIIGVVAFSTLAYCIFQKRSWKALLIVALVGLAIHPFLELASRTSFGKSTYFPMLWRPDASVADQADYMPLFPYISFFFLGAMVSKLTYAKTRKAYIKRQEWMRPICFLGRHTMVVYFSHFLVFIALFALVDVIFRSTFL